MPLLLILAFFAAAYLVVSPDPFTLRATRGAAGAIGSTLRSARSGPRSSGTGGRGTGARSTRSGKRSATRSTPDPSAPRSDPPRSRIGEAIRSGIRSIDRAEAKRTDLRAAIEEAIDRGRRRHQARSIERAERDAHVENKRQDRAAERARIRDGVKQTADQITDPNGEPMSEQEGRRKEQAMRMRAIHEDFDRTNPLPKTRPTNGARVTTRPDLPHIPTTELTTVDHAEQEVEAAMALAAAAHDLLTEVATWHVSFAERYAASDITKNGQMNAALALAAECPVNSLPVDIARFRSKLDLFLQGTATAKAKVRESDLQTGRVESARAS